MGKFQLGYNNEGRLSGDGMIEFSAAKEVDQAMEKNNQKMGWRWPFKILFHFLKFFLCNTIIPKNDEIYLL